MPWFQEITFTSLSCAFVIPTMFFLPFTLTSHTRTLWSAEQDAKTVASDGDHWMSSTDEVCEANGWGAVLNPSGVRVVR